MLIYVVSFLALAAVPLALGGYGGHLAAEVISNPKHRGNAMLTVWGLAALGVVLRQLVHQSGLQDFWQGPKHLLAVNAILRAFVQSFQSEPEGLRGMRP